MAAANRKNEGDSVKVLILGASGIIGQHMRLCQPADAEAIYARHKADDKHISLVEAIARLDEFDALVNLAGESNVDVVEKDPQKYRAVNVGLPALLAFRFKGHLVHVSSQIVRDPVNAYGQQKTEAETIVKARTKPWTIARPTFVLGIRPDPTMGRENPAEQMLRLQEQRQVYNRFFSVSFADEVAEYLWKLATGEPQRSVIELGWPTKTNRWGIAGFLNPTAKLEGIHHEDIPGIAPRPIRTVYGPEAIHGSIHASMDDGLRSLAAQWKAQHEPATICA